MREKDYLVDACFDKERGVAGIGVTFRQGRIVAGDIVEVTDLQSAELLAVLRAVEIASHNRSVRATIFTDCEAVPNALRGANGGPGTDQFEELLADLRAWLAANGRMAVSWLPRENTRPAHILAKQTYKAWLAGRDLSATWGSYRPAAEPTEVAA